MPEMLNTRQRGMNDLALHPNFSENHWIYFTYYKPVAGTANVRATLGRARYDGGHSLNDVREIFFERLVTSRTSADAMKPVSIGPEIPWIKPNTVVIASRIGKQVQCRPQAAATNIAMRSIIR
jgi:hypothetical protein